MDKIEKALLELDFIIETEKEVRSRMEEYEELLTNFSKYREFHDDDDDILNDFTESDLRDYVSNEFDVYDWIDVRWY